MGGKGLVYRKNLVSNLNHVAAGTQRPVFRLVTVTP